MLKKTNKAIAAKLMSLKPAEKVLELLTALGYDIIDSECSAFAGNYYMILNNGAVMIEDASM